MMMIIIIIIINNKKNNNNNGKGVPCVCPGGRRFSGRMFGHRSVNGGRKCFLRLVCLAPYLLSFPIAFIFCVILAK